MKSSYKKEHVSQFVEKITQLRCHLQRKYTNHPLGAMYGNPLFSFMLFIEGNGFKIEDISELYKDTFITLLPTVICFLNKVGLSLHSKIFWDFRTLLLKVSTYKYFGSKHKRKSYKGNIVHISFGRDKGNFHPHHQPELVTPRNWKTLDSYDHPSCSWQFLPHRDQETCLESNFSLLAVMLMRHLQQCVLGEKPIAQDLPTYQYLQHFFHFDQPVMVSEAKSNFGR